ncbi:MAG: transporter substrate-binding domain-containing protein [Alphaproteobacteria bacterium]|jgi:polar amino acid transport system substrate-binding protein|nr:transporter substrate-binding domain-containing protein [Alphaproteobacteria bacterium]MCB1550418.1 transporter substrate-binding domain-containing protein [Alphaproteobacteria bacterium]MCB9985317.1 transporter substrate-binding domain-containing protein [Micavibrio sp.]HPQ51494.1 transporter substrate-binding domain-containing protein [Alphaproteobacteria bacterium]
MKYFLTMFFGLCFLNVPSFAAEHETVFERMMRTQTIQCAYILYEPAVMKDPNTGQMSGVVVDLMDEIARRAANGMKVEWTVESTYATFAEDLKRPNVDLMCATLWTMADTGLLGTSTVPLWYSGLGAFVRADETRFQDLAALNSEQVIISDVDGSISGIVAAQDFPKAKILSLPHSDDYTIQLMNVVNRKADVAFLDTNFGAAFMAHNPDMLKNLVPERPLRVYSNALLVRKGEQEMLNFMNMALTELMNDGTVDRILNKHEAYPGSFYRVAKPYISGK